MVDMIALRPFPVPQANGNGTRRVKAGEAVTVSEKRAAQLETAGKAKRKTPKADEPATTAPAKGKGKGA